MTTTVAYLTEARRNIIDGNYNNAAELVRVVLGHANKSKNKPLASKCMTALNYLRRA